MIPNNWLPSRLQRMATYDPEGRLREVNISRESTGGIGDSNSLYQTDAERFGVMAPFIARAKAIDTPRRNYVVQPGGRTVYYETERLAPTYEIPDPRESFGHFTEVPDGPVPRPGSR